MNNLVHWYSNGFWLASFALILWHFFRDREGLIKLFQFLFVIGISVYAISFSFLPKSAGQKLVILSRDLLMMGVISLIFQFLREFKRLYWLAVIVLYALSRLFIGQWQRASVHQASLSYMENEWEILIELKDKDRKALAPIIKKYHLGIESAFKMEDEAGTTLDNVVALEVPEDQESLIPVIREELSALKEVSWVEENEAVAEIPVIPIIPYKSKFKPLTNDPHTDKQWSIELLGWNQVMSHFREGRIIAKKKARIFILDTGVDGKHEDLSNNYESVESRFDDDPKGHGTHCAGIAAAVTNNALGISSLNPGPEYVSVSSIKVLGNFGMGTQRDIINGILKAADQGADVINLSLGGRSIDSRQKAYSEAVRYANERGVIVVVAAGNDNSDARGFAPANADGVITVSAIDTSSNKASFSNSVAHIKNKIAAPGVSIFSTIPNNQYASFNGTSMAAPCVSGLVGLMKSIQPDLTTDQVYSILVETGGRSGDPGSTGPVIHAGRAIDRLLNLYPPAN